MISKFLRGSATLLPLIIITSLVFVLMGLSIFAVVYEKLLEQKALDSIHIEECADASEQIFNIKGDKVNHFNGCSIDWGNSNIAIKYRKMVKVFDIEWVPDFVVNVNRDFSLDSDSRVEGNIAVGKLYTYGVRKLLTEKPYHMTQTTWMPNISGKLYLTSTSTTVIFVGMKGMKTTEYKDWYYYAGAGTKANDLGYEYSNLIFQSSSMCYYTIYGNCEGEKQKVVSFDDGMKHVLPEVVLWRKRNQSQELLFDNIYRCEAGKLMLGTASYVLTTPTLSLTYDSDLKLLDGKEEIIIPSENSLFQGCNIHLEDGYYANLTIGAKNVEIANASIKAITLQAENITATLSTLDNVTLTATKSNVNGTTVSGHIYGDNAAIRNSIVRNALPSNEGSAPYMFVRIIH